MNHKELEKILKNKATCEHLHIIKALLNLKPLYLKKDSRSLYIFTTQELVLYFLPESFPLESCRDQQHPPPHLDSQLPHEINKILYLGHWPDQYQWIYNLITIIGSLI